MAADDSAKAEQLAQEVWQAAGGPNWPEVKTIDFTFAVVKGGKTVARAQHHWDVAAQTDHVQWKDKDVTVNLANPGTDENAKAAYARWTNDSYWLLMPLKLRDRGLHVTSKGMKEMDGAKRAVLRLSFDKVGLTPERSISALHRSRRANAWPPGITCPSRAKACMAPGKITRRAAD